MISNELKIKFVNNLIDFFRRIWVEHKHIHRIASYSGGESGY